jgi:hypothetical protein
MLRAVGGSAFVLALSVAARVGAQQAEPPVSAEKLRIALQNPQPSILIPAVRQWVDPAPTRLGFLTLVPPDRKGEMVKVAIPVGALVTRAARSISSAQRRRAERKGREKVLRELESFQAKQPPR